MQIQADDHEANATLEAEVALLEKEVLVLATEENSHESAVLLWLFWPFSVVALRRQSALVAQRNFRAP